MKTGTNVMSADGCLLRGKTARADWYQGWEGIELSPLFYIPDYYVSVFWKI